MDAAAIAEFACQSAQSRHQAFAPLTAPQGITYGGVRYDAVVSTLDLSRGDLERGGWPAIVSVTIRVLRVTGIAPVDGGLITINHSGRIVRITQIRDNVPAEWVLGCSDPEI